MNTTINYNEAQSCEIPKNRQVTKPVLVMRWFLKLYSLFSPKKSAGLINKLWFTPMKYKLNENAASFLKSAQIKDFKIKIGRKDVALYSWGEGDKTALLIHGWSGAALQMKSFVKPLVDKGYRVIAFDAPAHGLSNGRTTHIGEFSEVVEKISENVGKIDYLIAHSLGGAAAAKSIANGLNVKGIVCIGSIANLETCVKDFQYILGLSKKAVNRHCEMLEQRFGKNVWADYSIETLIKDKNIKGMLIHDKNDKEVSYQNAMRIQNSWPNAQTVFTNKLGHRKILRDKEVINKVCHFLDS
jgi:predicted alpha/beta hydrolase family esterase